MGRPGKKTQRLGRDGHEGAAESGGSRRRVLSRHFDAGRPERSYREHVPRHHRRRYGQFFTPEPIARLMLEWVRPAAKQALLDPAVGPGVFLRLAAELGLGASRVGMDVDPVALEAARRAVGAGTSRLVLHDFLTWQDDARFDAIVANPPYLRHHDLCYPFDIHAEIGRRNGVSLSRLSNAYVLFVLEICRRLTPGGRAAILVPGEWANANYGAALKQVLLSGGCLRKLVYFSSLSEQFEDALTTAAILLVEKSSAGAARDGSVFTYYVKPDARIADVHDAVVGDAGDAAGVIQRIFAAPALLGLPKWDNALENGLPEARPGYATLGALAATRRGIATGANAFFHLTEQAVRTHRIRHSNLKPCIGRAEDVKGLVFRKEDEHALRCGGGRAWLMAFEKAPTASESRYLARGIAEGLPERFLLATRKPWYSMERRAPAPIWAAVFGRKALRFVYNEAGAHNLTTFHGIYPARSDPLYCRALVACLNSTIVQSMAGHQRRVYGGGLMKFEPRDLLAIAVPDLSRASRRELERLAGLLERMDAESRASGSVSEKTARELDLLVESLGRPTRRRAAV